MSLPVSTESSYAVAEKLNKSSASGSPAYLVVYASHVDGRSWCGDCREAEPLVLSKFAGRANVTVVYAGVKEEWRKPENAWRQAPFDVKALPTIIKVTKGNTWEQLVEEDVYDQAKLDAFVE